MSRKKESNPSLEAQTVEKLKEAFATFPVLSSDDNLDDVYMYFNRQITAIQLTKCTPIPKQLVAKQMLFEAWRSADKVKRPTAEEAYDEIASILSSYLEAPIDAP